MRHCDVLNTVCRLHPTGNGRNGASTTMAIPSQIREPCDLRD
jgi:hypothetical protein